MYFGTQPDIFVLTCSNLLCSSIVSLSHTQAHTHTPYIYNHSDESQSGNYFICLYEYMCLFNNSNNIYHHLPSPPKYSLYGRCPSLFPFCISLIYIYAFSNLQQNHKSDIIKLIDIAYQ